ncbi:MAG: hypothetical protein GY784_03155 [Gammaproteobacteria bacterium]|nr:hypothetical protein [Gammaproteobacteria bacterium]
MVRERKQVLVDIYLVPTSANHIEVDIDFAIDARACGHNHLNQFNANDLTTWNRQMAELSGVAFSGGRK